VKEESDKVNKKGSTCQGKPLSFIIFCYSQNADSLKMKEESASSSSALLCYLEGEKGRRMSCHVMYMSFRTT